jgi:hypothetical protein
MPQRFYVSLLENVETSSKALVPWGIGALKKQNAQSSIKDFAKRLNAATTGGLIGMVAGKVKFRDEMAIIAATVLTATAVFRREGFLLGVAIAIAIGVGGSLLVRLWKWKVGVPRSSSDY